MNLCATTIAAALALIPTTGLQAGGEILTPELGFGDWTFDDSTSSGAIQVTWNSEEVMAGFQFDLPGIEITGASGGLSEDAGFAIAFNGDRIIGYFTSLDGYIHATEGAEVLLEIEFDIYSDTDVIRFDGVICARPDATSMKVTADDEIELDPPCLPDLNGDGTVNGADLTMLLANWGACSSFECPFDLNGDFAVDGADLTILLAGWGPCL
jgi:hypothetical protein